MSYWKHGINRSLDTKAKSVYIVGGAKWPKYGEIVPYRPGNGSLK
jgi:hypothetical protein